MLKSVAKENISSNDRAMRFCISSNVEDISCMDNEVPAEFDIGNRKR